ncbi:hypothetical protein ACWF9B_16560 [Streptomyces sp. NPDC055089]
MTSMSKGADPRVFGPEYPPVADPQSRRAAPESVTRDEQASAAWLYRALAEEERLRMIAEARRFSH